MKYVERRPPKRRGDNLACGSYISDLIWNKQTGCFIMFYISSDNNKRMSFCTIFNLYNIWTEFLTRYNPLLDLVGEELLDQKAGHRETPARDVTMMTSLAWLFSPVREVLPEVPALKYLFMKIWFMKYSLFCREQHQIWRFHLSKKISSIPHHDDKL